MKPIIEKDNARILLLFRHGLGDVVQFTSILQHLKHYYPHSYIAVAAKPGKDNICNELADKTYPLITPKGWIDERWDYQIQVAWNRPTKNYPGYSNSKITECLINEFGLEPIPDLYQYVFDFTADTFRNAGNWLTKHVQPWNPNPNDLLPPFALIHPYSESSTEDKHLTDEETELIANNLKWNGIVPIIIDYNCKYHEWRKAEQFAFLDGEFNAQFLLALCTMANAFYGIDSGPAHIAACCPLLPSVVIWKGTNAPYCFDPAPNCLHVVPSNMETKLHKEGALLTMDYFRQNFASVEYHGALLNLLNAGILPFIGHSNPNITYPEYTNAPAVTWGWKVNVSP